MPELPETHLDIEASVTTFSSTDGFVQHYRGLKMWKTRDDLLRYRAAIGKAAPEVVIETGTRWGGFAEWIAGEFDLDVITVDIQPVSGVGPASDRVTVITGNSANIGTIEQVRAILGPRRAMVVLDSDHHALHVEREIIAYGPLVGRGSYLVVEDGIADIGGLDIARRCGNRIPEVGGPLLAIQRQLLDSPDWTRDLEIERMSKISHHPAGWWLRA